MYNKTGLKPQNSIMTLRLLIIFDFASTIESSCPEESNFENYVPSAIQNTHTHIGNCLCL